MICTFYSYKGGVGRSMALANVADILARRGARVLMIDFDLEAPGLEQFFHVNIEGIRRRPGLLDLLLAYKQSMAVARGEAAFKNVEGFISPVYERLPGGGRLDIMTAGQRQDPEQLARYALALRTFDWQDFYYNWEGDLFFEWLRRELITDRYDLVLVDSRTGVTEMGGICGYQLADAIVMLCAANTQNVHGTAAMLRDFRSASVEALRRGRALDIVVVPARVEQRDGALLEDFFRRFDEAFAGMLPKTLAGAGIGSRELMIPYEPVYAFNERVVSDPDHPEGRRRIGDVFETLGDAVVLLGKPASRLATVASRGRAAGSAPAASDSAPATVSAPAAARYDPTRRFAGYDVYLDSSRSDDAIATEITAALRDQGLQVFRDRGDVAAGAEWVSVAEEALFHSRALVFCVGAGSFPAWRTTILEKAISARTRGQDLAIVPVLVAGAEPDALRATPLAAFQALDAREGLDARGIEALRGALAGTRASRVESEARAPYVGMRPFDEQHADLFFGRENAVREVLAHLDGGRDVLIVGPSGCGKTSLVQAGLIPALRARAPRERWAIAAFAPSARPSTALARAVAALTPEQGSLPADDLDQGDNAGRLDRLLADVLRTDASRRLLLFIDQAEELLGPRIDVEERARFLRLLESVAQGHDGRVRVVFAVRADARRAFMALVTASSWLQNATVELGTMAVDELQRMVQGPAERVGLAFEPGLVDRILADLQRGSNSLALAQDLLIVVWENRRDGWLTNAAYAAVGGMRGVVSTRADNVWKELAEDEQSVMRSIMVRLLRFGQDGETTRRRVKRRALLPASRGATGPPAVHDRVVGVLVQKALVVATDDSGEPALEASHESLVRDWPRLQGWCEAERDFLEWRERLDAAVVAWHLAGDDRDRLLRGDALVEAQNRLRERSADLNEDEVGYIRAGITALEAARHRRQRWILAASVAFAVWSLVLAVFAGWNWYKAVQKQHLAEETAALALSQAQGSREQAKQTEAALNAVQEELGVLSKFRVEAAQAAQSASIAQSERDRAERERKRAEAAAQELRTKLDQIQSQIAGTQRSSTQTIKDIEQLQRAIKK